MIFKITEIFGYKNTIFAALIGAVIGQLSILVFNWLKKKKDLRKKRNLIISDLKNQWIILERMELKLIDLKELFKTRKTDTYSGDVFHDLHKDIYDSVPKIELFEIFKDKLPFLVDVYGSILFLKENNPPSIYKNYVSKLNNHIAEKKDKPDHEFYCTTHLGFISIAITQIESNLNTIKDIRLEIKKII